MTPKERRQILIDEMNSLESADKSCRGCQGNCCTYEANSMMVTPIEAVELMDYLRAQNLLNDELKNKMVETVSKYRLNHSAGNGRKSYLRRTYTCPFFNHGEFGCPLPREVKPYGCLAFNSHHEILKADENCFSDIALLKKHDHETTDDALNEGLRVRHSLFWDKTPLPLALLDLWTKI
jgi:Fe-S-cluster containining protein